MNFSAFRVIWSKTKKPRINFLKLTGEFEFMFGLAGRETGQLSRQLLR